MTDREREEERQRKRERRSERGTGRARLVRNVRADASVSPPRVTGEYSFIKLGTRGVRAGGLRRAAAPPRHRATARSAVASCDRSVVGSQVFFVSLSHVPFSSVVDLARSSRLVLARAYAPSSLSLVPSVSIAPLIPPGHLPRGTPLAPRFVILYVFIFANPLAAVSRIFVFPYSRLLNICPFPFDSIQLKIPPILRVFWLTCKRN